MLQPINENLYPIFTPPGAPVKKRPRLETRATVTDYFTPATPTRPKAVKEDVWKIRRRRTGLGAYKYIGPSRCKALRHTPGPFQPGKPDVVFIPSIHPPTGRLRDHAPVLAVATSHAARAASGHLAVAGEEGGVRIVHLDEEAQGPYEGVWWRAHGNAIFDVSWSRDDTQLLTGAADATSRIHQLEPTGPRLVASLGGHDASVKATTFCGPHQVASAGRDGSIHVYDTRCRGRSVPTTPYAAGLPGFAPQIIETLNPVLRFKAHKSVTSLVKLQASHGLASGGSGDGIVKLWDMRSKGAISLPDPTIVASRRPRGVNSIVESPTTGDLYVLCGDAKIHSLRPTDGILPESFADPSLAVSSFFCKLDISPDGRHLAAGSSTGGVATFDTQDQSCHRLPGGKETSSVSWGHDVLVATTDSYAARIWRSVL